MADPVTPPILEIDSLGFRYRRGTSPAISDLTLGLEAGEILLVAGPSGCGKSTLVRAINGLIPHAYPGELTGTVRIDGRATTEVKLREIARTVGTVLQDPARQIVGATVEAELAFGPENFGETRDEIRTRIADVSARVDIDDLLGRETSALSGGERQLVAAAGALMVRPRLLVIDEPLANLDPATAERLLRLLRDLADAGCAVVIVEHRVEEALALRPDRVLYLDAGRQVYQGPVDGFLKVADPTAVKLPFEVVLDRVRAQATLGVAASRASGPDAQPGGGGARGGAKAEREDEVPRLEYRGVRAAYDGHEVLHGVDARFGRGEVVALLGPNGSGKTTLFRTAMRLMKPTAGSILVDGRPVEQRTTKDLAAEFGYVFQSPSQMLFARTVREELLFGPRNLARPEAGFDGLLDDVLSRTALRTVEGILERPPLTLSFGQQKRLAIAIALALEPATLILDEPSAGQDHRTAFEFMADVQSIPGLDSIYLITHDVDLALTHADRILLLRDGHVVAEGPPAAVIADEERWTSCNLRLTSLLRANARWPQGDGRLLDAETLARQVVAEEMAAAPLTKREVQRSSTS